jgi:hypothetical protein
MPRALETCSRLIGLALVVALMAGLAVTVPELAVTFAPIALLVCTLLLGIAPGEELIARLRAHWRPSRPRRPVSLRPRVRATAVIARVGHAFAAALAMRPPPHVVPAFS